MSRYLLLFLAATLPYTSPIYAQTTPLNNGTIGGTMLDEKAQPLAFATAVLYLVADSSVVKATLTDDNGAYLFDQLPQATYYVEGTYVGYEPTRSTTVVLSATDLEAQVPPLALLPSTTDLQAVTIVHKKPLIEMKADKMVLNVESSAIASSGTALDVLRRAPSVMVNHQDQISMKGKQGVVVMIDGKPSPLSPEELSRMLQNLPANALDRVEIISNPSAKYDAAGNAGIINIRLKKNRKLGFNGTASAGANYGWYWKNDAGLNLNYRDEKINLFGGYTFRDGKRGNHNWFSRTAQESDVNTTYNYDFRETSEDQVHVVKAGADWYVGKNTTLGVLTIAQIDRSAWEGLNKIMLSGDIPSTHQRENALTENVEPSNHQTYNLNLKHTFDSLGRELNADIDYYRFRHDLNSMLSTQFLTSDSQPTAMADAFKKGDLQTHISLTAAKIDYTHPLANGMLIETGIKSSYVRIDNDIYFEDKIGNTGEWIPDSTINNDFAFRENINAAYLNAQRQVGKWNIQAGLRLENTNNEGYSVATDYHNRQSYVSLFPSAAVSWQPNDKHALSLAYSRRIDRPTYQDLNPFRRYIDPHTYNKGNPFLQPQFTNSLTLSHTLMQAVNTSLSYSITNNVMMDVLAQDPNGQDGYQTKINMDTFENISGSLNIPIPIAKWWTCQLNMTGYYNYYRANYENTPINNRQWSFSGYAVNDITLFGSYKAELTAYYNSPLVWGMFQVKSMYGLDFGISKSFANGRANVRLALTDILYSQKQRVQVDNSNMQLDFRDQRDSRTVGISLSYKFGNNEVQNARRRQTATADERGRVKGGN